MVILEVHIDTHTLGPCKIRIDPILEVFYHSRKQTGSQIYCLPCKNGRKTCGLPIHLKSCCNTCNIVFADINRAADKKGHL